MALLNASYSLPEDSNPSFQFGIQCVANACRAPFQQIFANAGKTDFEIDDIKAELYTQNKPWHGIDLLTEKRGDCFQLGIIDPVKVTKTALRSAMSVIGQLVTATYLQVSDEKFDK